MAEIPESPPHLLSLVYGTASRAAKKAYFWCGTVMLFGLILTLPAAAQSVSEWRVSKVGVIDQPTANGHVYVGAGEQVTFYAIVSQVSGWPLPDGQGPLAVLKRVTGNGDVNVESQTKRVPSLGRSRSASMKFLTKLESEGRYTYKVCLTGLKEENGYPAAPLCG